MMKTDNLEIKYVEFDKSFLDFSYHWLKDDELRNLIRSSIISRVEQEEWFNALQNRTDYYIWGVKCNDIPIGVCGIKNITKGEGEYWGYIGEKSKWGKGYGKRILSFVEKQAEILSLNFLYLHVAVDNTRALNLYLKAGFIIKSETEGLLLMEKKI